MTENEAIKQLQIGYLGDTEDLVQAKHIAIQAISEIQSYRAIGTVEEMQKKLEELERWHTTEVNTKIENVFANTSTSICHNCDHKDEYILELEAEVKSLKENGAFTGVELAQICAMQSKLREYQAIGTIEEFKALKEKSVAKKPIDRATCKDGIIAVGDVGICPNCGSIVAEDMLVCEDCIGANRREQICTKVQ